MVDCEYCAKSFDGEDPYLEHLADAHNGELGAIDRRRVSNHTEDSGDGGLPVGAIAVGVIILAAAGLAVYATQLGGGGSGEGVEASALDSSGDSALLADVQQFPDRGNNHVEAGTDIEYERVPPLSGPHYSSTTDAGFYEETPALGSLVHTLEHGAVIVYYDPDEISPEARESLQQFATEHTGTWQSVVVAPNPSDDPRATYVVTAWRHELTMDSYDAETVHAFLSEYLGRGPENQVR